jgi:hypothetical protein
MICCAQVSTISNLRVRLHLRSEHLDYVGREVDIYRANNPGRHASQTTHPASGANFMSRLTVSQQLATRRRTP